MANRSPRSTREIDKHLGRRLRAARQAQRLSQSELAIALGISFQQIQKYEKGMNRISAGRLYEIAELLRLPIPSFFEGIRPRQQVRSRRRQRKRPERANGPDNHSVA
jgi:transcriptional regulator with XRE-family HTH domain